MLMPRTITVTIHDDFDIDSGQDRNDLIDDFMQLVDTPMPDKHLEQFVIEETDSDEEAQELRDGSDYQKFTGEG